MIVGGAVRTGRPVMGGIAVRMAHSRIEADEAAARSLAAYTRQRRPPRSMSWWACSGPSVPAG